METDIHHESALYLTDCDVKVGSIRGVFNGYLEMNNASLGSQRGVMFIFALTLVNSEITYPKGAAFNAAEVGIALHGRLYDGHVIISRSRPTSIIETSSATEEKQIFDLYGRRVSTPQSGIHLLRSANGHTRKVLYP